MRASPENNCKEIFEEIAERYDITIDTMEVMPDHVHLFVSFPPRYAIAEVVKILKSWSARKLYEEYRWLEREL